MLYRWYFRAKISQKWAAVITFVTLYSLSFQAMALSGFYDAGDEKTYISILQEAQAPLKRFYVGLQTNQLISSVTTLPATLPYPMNDLIVGRLNPVEAKDFSCVAVYCKDTELLSLLTKEAAGGRLILLSHAFTGVRGITLPLEEKTKKLWELFPDVNTKKSAIVANPEMTRDVFIHEMAHAKDQAEGLNINQFTETFEKSFSITKGQANVIAQFILEVRAYDVQRIYIENTTFREKEYDFISSDDDFSSQVIEVEGKEFAKTHFTRVNDTVNEFYLGKLKSTFKKITLSESDKIKLAEIMKSLLPQTGPYSFDLLVKPELTK